MSRLNHAPLLLGDQARPLFHLPNLLDMQQRWGFAVLETRTVGGDWRITLRPQFYRFDQHLVSAALTSANSASNAAHNSAFGAARWRLW